MGTFDWEQQIRDWSQKRIELLEEAQKLQLSPELIASGYLGYPGATEEQIVVAETRLGITFPPSYREFLKVSNGLRSIWEGGIMFYSTEEIDWFATNKQDWIDAWHSSRQGLPSVPDEKYFIYGDEQDCIYLRTEYMQNALAISSDCDGYIYLLNPQVVNENGEWEAWDFGHKLPGANRYRSFLEMMQFVFTHPEFII